MNVQQSSGKDFSMYTPKSEYEQPEGPVQNEMRKSRSSNRRGTRTTTQRTPNKGQQLRQSAAVEPSDSDRRLNKLIADYKAENERCTSKINDLKMRLKEQ